MGSIYCWFRGSTSKSKGGERGRGTGGKSRSCQETVWTLWIRSWPSQVGAIKLRIALGVGDIIEKNYRQPIYRNFSNYRQIIDIEFWEFGNYWKIIDIENSIQFYSINTIESIVLKTRKVPRWLTEKQQKSCSLPETFVAAKPTQTMVPDINLLWEAQLVSMSNKMCGGFAVDENIVEYSAFGLTGV